MLRSAAALFVLVLLALLGAGAPAEAREDIRGSIVKIYATYQRPNYAHPWQMNSQGARTGSGCVLAGGRVLTNAHVVSDQTFLQVRRAGRAEKYVARVEAVSHELDLALLTVEDESFFEGALPLELGELPSIGDPVTVLGFPQGGTRITLTEGIVSRIDRSYYSHSSQQNLVCQIDAAINSGSSGGPVLGGDGTIVGVAFQAGQGENEGYMVPAPAVRHFFDDIADGRHDGVPGLTFASQVLENAQLREHYGMTAKQSGVLITNIASRFSGEGKLQEKDILLAIDGDRIANDGTIAFRPQERITFRYAIDRKQVGETLQLEVLRDGNPVTVEFSLDEAKTAYGNLVPREQYDVRPSYFVVGGLVFAPLTSNYYDVWDAWDDVPRALRDYYDVSRNARNEWRDEVVVLIDYLPDELNVGFDFEDAVVSEVNGRRVSGLRDLIDAIESHDGPAHRIVFEANDWEVVLRKDLLEASNEAILRAYGVPSDRSRDLAPERPTVRKNR